MKKGCFYGLIVLISMSCNQNSMENTKNSFYIGTYTNAESKGIYQANLNAKGEFENLHLLASSENPSFLAFTKDRDFIVAVNESTKGDKSNGAISSYRILNDSLVYIDKMESYGDIPCHVTITNDDYVITSNYMGGNVVLSKINPQGKLTFLDSIKHTGKTNHPRQEMPHVHSTWIHPKTQDVIAVDLGTNELWFYQIDKSKNKLIAKQQQKLAMNSGAGPRHATFHPKNSDWMYVLNELNASVSLVVIENGEYVLKSTESILPKTFTEYNASADIHISSDGKFLYASNRGHNSIAILKIDAKDGSLSLVDIQKISGSWPRNFALSRNDEFLVYANKWTNNIFSMKRDIEKGTLVLTDSIQVPNPVMILF